MDSLVNYLLSFSDPAAYTLVFLILLGCGLGIPIPEDITLFAAGMLSYYGVGDVYSMIVVSLAGVLIGDVTIYFLGARFGRNLTKKWFFKRILSPERLEQVQVKLNEHGNKIIFSARFMPGFRAPVYFTSGTLHLPFRVFIFYDGIAAMISVPAIVYTVYYFGYEVDYAIHVIQKIEHGILTAILSLCAFFGFKWYLAHRKANSKTNLK